MESILQIENLTKSYGDRLLFGDITFGVNEGDKIGIIAKNGTGKSTLLKILCNKEDYDSGNIIYRQDVRVGFLEQTPELNPNKTVLEVCMENYNSNEDDVWDYENRMKQTLSQLKITDFNQKISELSGGQLKRVALSKIIIKKCDLIILDEPTNHLDPDTQKIIANNLKTFPGTIIVVSHNEEFVDYLGIERTLVLPDGRIDYYDKNVVVKYHKLNEHKKKK